MQPVLNPAISKYGHVLGAATWKVRNSAHNHARTGCGKATLGHSMDDYVHYGSNQSPIPPNDAPPRLCGILLYSRIDGICLAASSQLRIGSRQAFTPCTPPLRIAARCDVLLPLPNPFEFLTVRDCDAAPSLVASAETCCDETLITSSNTTLSAKTLRAEGASGGAVQVPLQALHLITSSDTTLNSKH